MKPLVLALALAGGLACQAPAFAQTPLPGVGEPDPLSARDARRVDRMEQVVRELRAIVFQGQATGRPVVVQGAETEALLQSLTQRLDDLEAAQTRQTGDVELARRDLDTALKAIDALKAQNDDLKARLAVLEQAAAPPPPAAPAPAPAAAASPAELFSQARQALLDGDNDAAEEGFQSFVDQYGDTAKGPEARYYLGKTLMVRRAYTEAATAYIGAIRGWPATAWAPDAVFDLARALVALKQPQQACQALTDLSRRYPKAPADVVTRATKLRQQAQCAA